jgi:glycosyltransferase involved in cell wall biosynthesis
MLVANCQDEIDAGRALGVTVPARPLGVAVDLEQFHTVSGAERRRHREALGIGDGQRVMVVLGRIAHQKGQDLLVPEWERRHRPGQLLVLVGPGDTTELQAMAPTEWGRSILAVGEPDSVLPWLWAADLLLTPSRYETVGLVVAEALSTGLPVVATGFDGAAETITGSGLPAAGAVVPLGAMSRLLDAAEERLGDDSLMTEEQSAARARAERLFRPDVMAERLEAAYRDALTSVRGGVLL